MDLESALEAVGSFTQQSTVSQSSLGPVLLTAGGALLGVLLTITVQTFNLRSQRVHEKLGKAFELKFAMYAELARKLERNGDIWTEVDMLLSADDIKEPARLAMELEQLTSRTNLLIEELNRYVTLKEVAPTASRVEEVADELQQLGEQLQALGDRAEAMQSVGSRVSELQEEGAQNFRDLNDQIAVLNLLADSRTVATISPMINALSVERRMSESARYVFRNAVRRELGIGRGKLRVFLLDWRLGALPRTRTSNKKEAGTF